MKQFKPMLAKDADLSTLRYPLIASPKLDGIRATVLNGVLTSRSLKPIPNKHIQTLFPDYEYHDGELIVGSPTSKTVYRDTVSEVMSHDRVSGAKFYVFDHIENFHMGYAYRSSQLRFSDNVIVHESRTIETEADLRLYEEDCLDRGYEGLILRDPSKPYKFGRSTPKEQALLKLKRFVDAEALVVDFDELLHNANEATVNELGNSSRSSHKENKVPMNTLGSLKCVMFGSEFNIGTGFDAAQRQEIWDNRAKYIGRLAKFKHFPIGAKDAPRHPVFLGWRMAEDLG